VAQLGESATAATNLAFNVNSVAFIPPLGLAIAVTTLVGQQIGAGRKDLADRVTWTGFQLAGIYTGVLALLYVLLPDLFLAFYAAGKNAAEFATIRQEVIVLLRFVAAYCVFDAMNLVFSGALRGAGDTRFILKVGLLMCPIPGVLTWIGVRYLDAGLVWSWWVLTLWTCVLGVVYLIRYLQGHWRNIWLIEQAFIEESQEFEPAAVGADDRSEPKPSALVEC